MIYKTLGRSGLKASEIGLGCEHLEGLDAKTIHQVVDTALEGGVNILDVFMSEPNVRRDIGLALKGRRDKVLIQGHFGARWKDGQYGRTRERKETQFFFEDLLHRLDTDYIDLLLVHQPFGDYYGTYRAMEKAYRDGKVRAIGLSNFYDARFVDLAENMEIKPAVLQLETHVFSQQTRMRELIKDYGTRLMAWGPLAQGTDRIFTNETLKNIGAKYGKTSAQVALNFLTGEGIVAIPKSVHTLRMTENLDIESFELTETDQEMIRKLDTGLSKVDFNDPAMAK